jgi:NADPH:quinone reductase-like Zn-dependent oxidoreductase
VRAIWITKHGGPGVLQVRESEEPTPAAGEVRIRVRASGLNFSDLMARQGLYPDAPKPPCVVGYEAAGVVDAVGEGVTSLDPGARVLALTRFGGQADTVCVPEMQAMRISDATSFEQGAALPVVYLTAYHILFRVAALRPGMTVLVHMAGGGVGLAVLQLCRTVGGVTTLGTASRGKHAAMREHGCDHPIDYRTEDYAQRVREITGGRGVDLVLDPRGGGDWTKGYDLLGPAGMLVAFGFANMASGQTRHLVHVLRNLWSVPKFSPMSLMGHNRAVAGVNVGHLWNEVPMLAAEMHEILALFDAGKVRPVIDSTFAFAEARAAHERMHARQNVGKIVLVP